MATDNKYRTPFVPVHPGGILREELKERGFRQCDFAKAIGIPATQLYAFVRGEQALGEGWAELFERQLGIDAELWTGLQSDYDRDVQNIRRREEQEMAQVGSWIKSMLNGGVNALTPRQRSIFTRGILRVARQLNGIAL